MRNCAGLGLRILFFAWAVILVSKTTQAEKIRPEDIVARHLASIGTPEARSAVKTRIVQGTSKFTVLVGGGGQLHGTAGLVSEQRKSDFVINFHHDYRGEQFVSNGDQVYIAATTANHKWSSLGEFVRTHDYIVREGLFGGTLSTVWALQNLDYNQPQLSYTGMKKIDGQHFHEVQYRSRKNPDLTVRLYFDPQTFRHTMTIYTITAAAGLGTSRNYPSADPTRSSQQQEIRYTLEERFSDFKVTDGLTLPFHYNIHLTQELQSGQTTLHEWDITADRFSINASLDPKNFQVK